MSTTIIPDIYRHFARKSTVSKNARCSSKSLSNIENKIIIIKKNECDYKLDNSTFLILPDNEIEQIDDNNNIIITDLIEEMICRLDENISNEIQNAMESMLDQIDENNFQNSSDVNMTDISSVTEDPPIAFRPSISQNEILSSQDSTCNEYSRLCNCQCHEKRNVCLFDDSSAEYELFEQALIEVREEHKKSELLNNNRILQLLKHQNEILLNFCGKQKNVNKIDREQQTSQPEKYDSQIQTESFTSQQNFIPKPFISQLSGTPTVSAHVNYPPSSYVMPIITTGPSLQQLIPCLTTTSTILSNKTSIIANIPSNENMKIYNKELQSTQTKSVGQDIVDLTKDDDNADDDNDGQMNNSNKLEPNSMSTFPSQTFQKIRNQQVDCLTRPNTTISTEMYTIRSLPEHSSCDFSIGRPQLTVVQSNETIRLTWNIPSVTIESISNYEIYACKKNTTVAASDWKKIGVVKSMRLPMVVTLKEFQSHSHYVFVVRAISIKNTTGPFCEPKAIVTKSIDDQLFQSNRS